jgi:hypothetical protein
VKLTDWILALDKTASVALGETDFAKGMDPR